MMKKFFVLFICMMILCFCVSFAENAENEEEPEYIPVIVTGSNLNARMSPNPYSYIITSYDKNLELNSTGRWSKDKKWVEIMSMEYGPVWCSYKFLTERTEPFKVETLCDEPVKIRKFPGDGRVTGYLRKGKTIIITQVILGYGKCKKGWIDLGYCIELEEENNEDRSKN